MATTLLRPGGTFVPESPFGPQAITVPSEVMPETATSNVVPSFGAICVMTTVFVPPAVPVTETSEEVKVETEMGSENAAVKWTELEFVGSGWVPAWSMATVGLVVSYV